jgi:oligogalacturonide lyase
MPLPETLSSSPPKSGMSVPRGVRVVRDPETRRELWQVTARGGINHHPYFYSQAWSADERFFVYGVGDETRLQLCVLDFSTGEHRQLTDEDLVNTTAATFGPQGHEIYFVVRNRIEAIDARSGARRVVCDFTARCAPETQHTRPVFTADGARMVFYYQSPRQKPVVAWVDPRAGGAPVEAGEFAELERVAHVLVHPHDADFVTFVPFPDRQERFELGPRERARCWHLDLRTGETRPYLVMPTGYRATHEFWDAKGERMYFFKKTVPDWTPVSLCSMAKAGGDFATHYTSTTSRLGHAMLDPQGKRAAMDNQAPGRNELRLVDLGSGRDEILCWPNASGRGHPRHVHPIFSPSGRHVAYSSDAAGDTHVFIVPLP